MPSLFQTAQSLIHHRQLPVVSDDGENHIHDTFTSMMNLDSENGQFDDGGINFDYHYIPNESQQPLPVHDGTMGVDERSTVYSTHNHGRDLYRFRIRYPTKVM